MSTGPPDAIATLTAPDTGGTNRLIGCLPAPLQQRLLALAEPVDLALKQVVVYPEEPFHHTYFVTGGIISLLVVMEDGNAIEATMVGEEGIAGLPTFLEQGRSPHAAVVQVAGSALRVPADAFLHLVRTEPPLRDLLARYTATLYAVSTRNAACNRLHPVEARLPRWLLAVRDRVHADSFQITHEFLAQMLGVRRAGVSVVAEAMQEAGLIRYRRGRMELLQPGALEEAACEDYHVIRAEYERLFD